MDLTARGAAKDQKAEFGSVAALALSPPIFCSDDIEFKIFLFKNDKFQVLPISIIVRGDECQQADCPESTSAV